MKHTISYDITLARTNSSKWQKKKEKKEQVLTAFVSGEACVTGVTLWTGLSRGARPIRRYHYKHNSSIQ
jgi:hypothetical protein